MKTIALIFLMALAASAERPAWVDLPQVSWRDSGNVYIKAHVVSKDLDHGMNSTKSRFKDELAAHFCNGDENVPCMYFNFTIVQSYWEIDQTTNPPTFQIYRLFSIKDVYSP